MSAKRYSWAGWGDINAFFGLMLDNVAVLIALLALTTGPGGFSREFVLSNMIPGSALGVLIGDLVYVYLAFRLARRTGRDDVTAMPLGLDTPSTIAVGPLVLLPALHHSPPALALDAEGAMYFAWHVGAVLLVLVGVCKTVVAPVGGIVRRLVPRAGLLGSLASIAIALIAFVPLWQDIAAVPVVGMVALTIILVALVAHRPMPGKIPGALMAVIVGVALYQIGLALGPQLGWPIVRPHPETPSTPWHLPHLFPPIAQNAEWWRHVLIEALGYMPIMLPFALATVVGGIDCTESAAAAGDEFDTRSILVTEGVASMAAGLFGGVIQNTPYIGHPAYKAMGGRAAYTLATALFIGLAGAFGWFAHLFEWLPEPVMFPILVFVGLEILAQSFKATPVRHYAALGLAILPALAYMATIPLDIGMGDRLPPPFLMGPMQSLRCLANGFIVTSLLWAAALASILDGRLRFAALFLLVAALCSLVGIIHSPLNPAQLAWPTEVMELWQNSYVAHGLEMSDAIKCQSPYHWATAYMLSAAVLLGLAGWKSENARA